MLLSKRRDNPFLAPRSCCRTGCFCAVDSVLAFGQYKRIMSMNREERKRTLIGLLSDDRKRFRFNGNDVCARFLSGAFHFSACLRSCVKGTNSARAGPEAMVAPKVSISETEKDVIIRFIRKMGRDAGDILPHRSYINITVLIKLQVYEEFRAYFISSIWSQTFSLHSQHYFYRIWKRNCTEIRTHRNHGFTICSRCEQIRAMIAKNLRNEKVLEPLRQEHKSHIEMMTEERREYGTRQELAVECPARYCSLIVDGADQKSYGLPHFLFGTKSDKGHKIKVRCVDVLEHRREKCLSLFTMTEEFESGANNVIESIQRVLNKRKTDRKLPPVLFVQADNCTRENKNRFFLAYFELLAANGVFKEVQISFLPVGHTHTDIDQSFCSVATKLKTTDAITMEELLGSMRNSYMPRAFATGIRQVANFSGLCLESGCLSNAKKILFTAIFDLQAMKQWFLMVVTRPSAKSRCSHLRSGLHLLWRMEPQHHFWILY